jgi:hypothetical protein
MRHGEGFAGARCTEQGLKPFAFGCAADKFIDGGGLVALGLVGAYYLEIGHWDLRNILGRQKTNEDDFPGK